MEKSYRLTKFLSKIKKNWRMDEVASTQDMKSNCVLRLVIGLFS
jgi:hypothetical protein